MYKKIKKFFSNLSEKNNENKNKKEFIKKIENSISKIKYEIQDDLLKYSKTSYIASSNGLFFIVIHIKYEQHKCDILTIDCCISGKINLQPNSNELLEYHDIIEKIVKEEVNK